VVLNWVHLARGRAQWLLWFEECSSLLPTHTATQQYSLAYVERENGIINIGRNFKRCVVTVLSRKACPPMVR
jgi:hypothetical protein